MAKASALVLCAVLVLGGPIGCAVKAALGIEQRKFLPKRFVDELKNGTFGSSPTPGEE